MGYFYTLGIAFDQASEAQECKSILEKQTVRLSDSSKIQLRTHIGTGKTNTNKFIVDTVLTGMEIPNTNSKLFVPSYFYEIRKQIYQFLFQLPLPFRLAHFEFEAADELMAEDVLLDIKKTDLGESSNGDSSPSVFSGISESEYLAKNYYDGLIVSENLFDTQLKNLQVFKPFKPGYWWLPINGLSLEKMDLR